MPQHTLPDPDQWVDQFGDLLYRYAIHHLRRSDAAEDAVQETFIAALRARDSFQGRSSPQTWLVGILKKKIFDAMRKQYRERPVSEPVDGLHEAFSENAFFKWGHWVNPPSAWNSPEKALEDDEFWVTLNQCMEGLTPSMSEAFSLRTLEDCPTEDICNILNISPTNLGVLLHRARLRLRQCLENNWFQRGER